ncbi:ABC transporter permease [Streptomyces sp. AK010]|uniref:ABC transporter permease n=1 Tax=Streptomyces sp. AK010 TaxID=2723074 RepID=UPI0017A7767A|nr:ABC transporter permease [Streptomyces sp. AK010]MBB6421384.1 putative ABC transport system permease protein [Streptomyces sp. AK010]
MMTKLTLRNLAAHRLRLLFTLISVALGVAFVAGTMIFTDTTTRALSGQFAGIASRDEVMVRPADSFSSDGAAPRLIPQKVMTDLEKNVDEARSLVGAVEGYAAILQDDGKVVRGDGLAQLGRSYVERPDSEMRISSGKRPEAADEVVVEDNTAKDGAITVGDRITVVTERTTRSMRVAGLFTLGDDTSEDVSFVGFAPDAARDLLGADGSYTALWAAPAKGVSSERLEKAISAELPAGFEARTAREVADENTTQIQSLFGMLNWFLLAFAGVAVLVGSFIILNTFSMLMTQRVRSLALLRAVGAHRGQVTRAVLGEAACVGFLGALLGLGAGAGLSYLLRAVFSRLGTKLPLASPVIEADTVAWSLAVGVLVTVVAAYLPARRAAKVPPVAALRDDIGLPARGMKVRTVLSVLLLLLGAFGVTAGLQDGGEEGATLVALSAVFVFVAVVMLSPVLIRPMVKVLGWPAARLGGMVGRLSRENARRAPRRSAATASAMTVGLALITMATVLAASMNTSADRRIERQFRADFFMESRGTKGFTAEAVDRVAAVRGVKKTVSLRQGVVKLKSDEQGVAVADPVALADVTTLDVSSGSASLREDEVLVQRSLAEQKKWKVGSAVPGEYPDGHRATFRIKGLYEANEIVEEPLVMSTAGYRAHSSGTLVRQAFVTLDDSAPPGMRQALASALRAFPNVALKDSEGAKANARSDVDRLLNIVTVLLVLSVLVAAVGLVNTLGLSVMERTREIGLLRAVGMSGGQVRAMVSMESVIIAVFGVVVGLGLGVGTGWLLQRAMTDSGVEHLALPLLPLALYLLGGIAVGLLAALWPARRAARMHVLRAIQQQ